MPSTSPHPISPEATPDTEAHDQVIAPAATPRAALSPADTHTLQKIIEDVRSPSPRTDMHAVENQDDDSSSAGYEDEVRYSEIVGGLVDEEDGYEDQDESMDEEEGDTVEDMMNLPGKTAPEVPVRDFSALYVHEEEVEGKKEVELFRKGVERRLVEERVAKEKSEVLGDGWEDVADTDVEESEKEVCSSANIDGFGLFFDLGSTNAFEDISKLWARINAC
jgi:hypothetical protein